MSSPFLEHRDLLFAVAYRILGSAADAEDAVQDAWMKWSAADRSAVTEPRAYLVRIVSNLAVDRLRAARARRETYVGPWLPEPILTGGDAAEDATVAESVSTALLVVLETLTPIERAVFVLKEVFGFGHAEIAEAVGRSEDTVRQAAHRAREHVRARRPRFPADRRRQRAVTERFFAAAAGGDLNTLMQLLAPDVTIWTDGGGKVHQAPHPITGARKVATWLATLGDRPYQGIELTDMEVEILSLNGVPSLVFRAPGRMIGTMTLDLNDEGHIAAIHNVANPDKLAFIASGRIYPLERPR